MGRGAVGAVLWASVREQDHYHQSLSLPRVLLLCLHSFLLSPRHGGVLAPRDYDEME